MGAVLFNRKILINTLSCLTVLLALALLLATVYYDPMKAHTESTRDAKCQAVGAFLGLQSKYFNDICLVKHKGRWVTEYDFLRGINPKDGEGE